MSAHKQIDSEGREWLIGFDNPCDGYFATRFVPPEELERDKDKPEADVYIGFGDGVDLATLIKGTSENGLDLDESMIEILVADQCREAGPVTALQEQVLSLVDDLIRSFIAADLAEE